MLVTPEARRLIESFVREQVSKLEAAKGFLRNAEIAVSRERGLVAMYQANIEELQKILTSAELHAIPGSVPSPQGS